MLAKVCLVGPKDSGKSTLATRFDRSAISKLLKGVSLVNWNTWIGNYKVELQIWDTCGEDRFRCMGPILYKAAKAAVCMFDLTSKASFQDVQAWLMSVQQNAMDECILVLLGNKKDMEHERKITEKDASKYAESVGATYFEISATTGEGVSEAFQHVALCLVRQQDCYSSYHAKLAISSSSMGVSDCTRQERNSKKGKGIRHSACFPCLSTR